jgi:hypothetical protein
MGNDTARLRQHKRHQVALRVRYEGPTGHIESVVGDISLGGLRIAGPVADAVGATVELTIALPHLSRDLLVKAEVVWLERDPFSNMATVGLRFLDLDPQLNVMLSHIFREGIPA